jgi:hypothetical protein
MFIGYFRWGVGKMFGIFVSLFVKRNKPIFIVARGRIELPTPCFSDKGKPYGLT